MLKRVNSQKAKKRTPTTHICETETDTATLNELINSDSDSRHFSIKSKKKTYGKISDVNVHVEGVSASKQARVAACESWIDCVCSATA